MYRHTFSFTLKLTIELLQKLTTFYVCNVKQKDYRMDHSTFHCCYSEFVTRNQQTYINKTFCRYFASLPCHITFKDMSKFII